MVDLKVPAAPAAQSLAAWLRDWAAAEDQPEVTFVLPAERLHASALVMLGAMASQRRQRGLASRVEGDGSLSTVMARSLIGDAVSSQVFQSSHGYLVRQQSIRDERAAKQLADSIREALAKVVPPVSTSIVRMASFVSEELGVNVVQHSGRPETGYGYATANPDLRYLELAFADAGVGFRASLQRNPELEGRVSDDAEALQLALSPRITGTSSPRTNMGIGLKTLTDFSDLLGGDLWIASGSALLQRRTTAGQRTNVMTSIPAWHGSWISLEAPIG